MGVPDDSPTPFWSRPAQYWSPAAPTREAVWFTSMGRGPDLFSTRFLIHTVSSPPVTSDATENEVRATGRSCDLADIEIHR